MQRRLDLGDALESYPNWPKPTAIISDGPYGLSKFPGDPDSPEKLGEWYAPHIAEWTKNSLPETTLWLWCSEIGWAEIHPVLKLHGWKYKAAHIWDKGIGHIAGNCNGNTIRSFPVVSELCVQYVREVKLRNNQGEKCSIKEWMRNEWKRSGLPLSKTNDACGVKDAATRKYFTLSNLWYFPPPEKMESIVRYANLYGEEDGKPYFSLDGKKPLTADQWKKMRPKWNHIHGVTNVWREPAVRNNERIRKNGKKSLHANQKPLKLMERIVLTSTEKNDVIWEPFGGLCSGSIAAIRNGRRAFAAENIPEFFYEAQERFNKAELNPKENDQKAELT